ncbi:MAG: hypothetical protein WC462_02930 [archaeon]
MHDVLIVHPPEFELKKKKFFQDGPNSIQIVTDFDRTLTVGFYKGEKVNTAISQIRQNNLLGEEYTKKSFALFDKYRPIEADHNIPMEKKIPLMEEWWSKHLKIIVKHGMTKKLVNEVTLIQSRYMRKGFRSFFRILYSEKIPVLILSSALGDVIEGVLEKYNLFTDNIHVISNYFDFNKEGKAIGYKGKIIHVFNKDESQIKGTPHFSKIASRKNIILMGDSLGDLKMVGQITYDEIIRIGFLEENNPAQLEEFKKHFDVILFNDASLDFVNNLLKNLIRKK